MTIENQHWIPRFLVKRFADVDGRVYRLNLSDDSVTKLSPRKAASGPNFYDFMINGGKISYESGLEKIETAAAPVLQKLVESRSTFGLTAGQRQHVANFVAAQSFRTDAFYQSLGDSLTHDQYGAVFAQLWRSASVVSEEVLGRRWVLMSIEGDEVFYLGDQPVVFQNTDHDNKGLEMGFGIAGVEALMPLSPKCALYMPCKATAETVISGYQLATLNSARIRRVRSLGNIPENVLQQYEEVGKRILQNQRELYEALTVGRGLVAEPANVENLNALQCEFAHAAIYSCRRDFSFAQKVFAQTPQYRPAPRARLGMVDWG